MNGDQIVRRARSVLGGGCRYGLGKGGNDPAAAVPWNARMQCDCSGFTCWVLKLDRRTDHPLYKNFNGGWINTDAMWKDGNEPVGIFRRLAIPQLGALVVYPRKGNSYGHVGIVSGVGLDGAITAIIHCSQGNYRSASREAIQENAGAALLNNPNSIIIWYEGATLLQDELMRSGGRFN